jgi:hypothetical protein
VAAAVVVGGQPPDIQTFLRGATAVDIRIESGSAGTAVGADGTNFTIMAAIPLATGIPARIREVRVTGKSADSSNAIGDVELEIRAAGDPTGGSTIANCTNLSGGLTALNAAPFTSLFSAQPRILPTGGVSATVEQTYGDALAPQGANWVDGPPRGTEFRVPAGKVIVLKARNTQAQTWRWSITLSLG